MMTSSKNDLQKMRKVVGGGPPQSDDLWQLQAWKLSVIKMGGRCRKMLQVSELTCPPASTIGIIDDTMLAASVENLDKSVGAAS